MDFTAKLEDALRHATFHGDRSEPLSLEQLQHAYRQRRTDSSGFPVIGLSARARVPDEPLAKLADHLRTTLLAEFVDSDRDRVGVIGAVSPVSDPSVEDFALKLVRVAATLGARPTARLVAEWANGRPLSHRLKTLLSVAPEGRLTLDDGVSVRPRPKERSMPQDEVVAGAVRVYGYFDFLRGSFMTIDCETNPVFYPPAMGRSSVTAVRASWAQPEMPDQFLDTFCDSLSLACNGCVRHGPYWYDFGPIEEFGGGSFGWTYSLGPRLHAGPPLSQRHLELARDIHRQRFHAAGKGKSLDTAISRWIKSKHPHAELVDRFIDLRIALEALYLQDGGMELKYRLTTRAAWHLGRDIDERTSYLATVQKAYDSASRAVHANEIADDPPTRTLLSNAQDVCRDGILKRLDESSPPDWSRLVLGDEG